MATAVIEREVLPNGIEIRVAKARAHVHVEPERSKRELSHMDGQTKLIHARLEEWARHVNRPDGPQGYPSESYNEKWARLEIAPEPGHEPMLPERVANVDAAVARLCTVDRAVIERKYRFWRPTDLWKGIPGIKNKAKFDTVLKRARWRVDGHLGAIEKDWVEKRNNI